MASVRTFILAASIVLILAGVGVYFTGYFSEKTLADEITLLEREAARNPPPPDVVRECDRKMTSMAQMLGVTEGMEVPYGKAEGEAVLVAVVGRTLECEKTARIENSVLTYRRYGNPGVWVMVDSETFDELYNMSQGSYSREDIVSRVSEYLAKGSIRVHPYSKLVDMVGEMDGGDKR